MEPPATTPTKDIETPRQLPDMILNPNLAAEAIRKLQRERAAQKKKTFKTIFKEVKAQRRRDNLPMPRGFSSEVCWRKVASGKFRGADMNGDYVKGLMHRGIIESVEAEIANSPRLADLMLRARLNEKKASRRLRNTRIGVPSDSSDSDADMKEAPQAAAHELATAPAPAPAPNPEVARLPNTARNARRIPLREQTRAQARAEARRNTFGGPVHTHVQAQARAPATEVRGPAVEVRGHVPIPVIAIPLGGGGAQQLERVMNEALAAMDRRMFNVDDRVPDELSAEAIEHLFSIKGVGESGSKCPICDESKRSLVRMNNGCSHSMCTGCCEQFIDTNVLKDGARCFGCVAESSKTPGQKIMYVDPRLVFNGKIDTFRKISFSSFQVPKLQAELDSMEPKTTEQLCGPCPLCGTVSMTGKTVLRRCLNPRCCVEFCVNCNTTVDTKIEDRTKHLSKSCTEMATEAHDLTNKPGMSPCSRCGTPLSHAKGHGCHHVKCSSCSFEMCHNCGKEWTTPQSCKCPLFCRSDFKCRCADECPECKTGSKPCIHCSGSCKSCLARKMAYPHSKTPI